MTDTKSDKVKLQEELIKIQQEINQILKDCEKRICHYRLCGKEFPCDDKRKWYCSREHYRLENIERTRDKNKLRKEKNGHTA